MSRNMIGLVAAFALVGLAGEVRAADCGSFRSDAFDQIGNDVSCELSNAANPLPLSIGDHLELFGEFNENSSDVFQDWNFTVDATSDTVATVNLTALSNITGLSAQFVRNGFLVGAPVAANQLLTLAGIGPGDNLALRVFAAAVGATGGNYTGNLNIVPLPGALVFMATALAGLGLARWRRREAAPAAV